MMRWKPNITICDTLAGNAPRALKTCAMCARGRAPLSAQVMPSISKERKKKKKGADATTNRTAVGHSLASNHACPLG